MVSPLVQAPLANAFFGNTLSVLVLLAPHCLGWNLGLGHVEEYAHVTKALALLALALASVETINVLQVFRLPYLSSPC
jgi:hypothetical protein